MKSNSLRRAGGLPALAVLLLCGSLLGACDSKNESRTVGQKIDDAVAKSERKSEELKGDARAAGKEVRDAATNVADSAAAKTRDMAITTQVNAQLARDTSLSALSINVDTNNGQVVLRGTAPNSAEHERATALAKAVEGVTQVDNQLTLKPAP